MDGHDPVVAQTAFAKRYGDEAAGQVFGQKRAVLKRNVTPDTALQMQGSLAEVGLIVALTPAISAAAPAERPARSGRSIVERAGQRSQARKQAPSARETADAPVSAAADQTMAPAAVADAVDESVSKKPIWKWVLVALLVLVPLVLVVLKTTALI